MLFKRHASPTFPSSCRVSSSSKASYCFLLYILVLVSFHGLKSVFSMAVVGTKNLPPTQICPSYSTHSIILCCESHGCLPPTNSTTVVAATLYTLTTTPMPIPQQFLFHSMLFPHHPSISFVALLSTSHTSRQILLFSSPTNPLPFFP